MELNTDELREKTLGFIARHNEKGKDLGIYRYSQSSEEPTLYSSAYAVMTRSLYNDLNLLSFSRKEKWAEYLNSFQDDDGLYKDPVIYNQGWYKGDPLWCGRPHLTCHVITALACLGAIAPKPFKFLNLYKDKCYLCNWLEERDWGTRVGWTGNEIMNVGTLLQYARDFQNDHEAGKAAEFILDWLSTFHINSETGIWSSLDISDPLWRSHAVQAAYHWWPLFYYDKREVPYIERAIDTVLATQNLKGGFGCGVHNPEEPYKSSACEDIDSIDPLARMMQKSDYRREDIRNSLIKSVNWVLQNQMQDGGFVFMLDRSFEYGHPQLYGEKNIGAMFPTWFRTLSLAVIGKALPDCSLGEYNWKFVRCPGFQFW